MPCASNLSLHWPAVRVIRSSPIMSTICKLMVRNMSTPPKSDLDRALALAAGGIYSESILNRLSSELNVRTDTELAHALGISKTTVSAWRKRNSIPYEHIVYLAMCGKIDLSYVLLGDISGKKDKDILKEIPKNLEIVMLNIENFFKNDDYFNSPKTTIIIRKFIFERMMQEARNNAKFIEDNLQRANFDKILEDALGKENFELILKAEDEKEKKSQPKGPQKGPQS